MKRWPKLSPICSLMALVLPHYMFVLFHHHHNNNNNNNSTSGHDANDTDNNSNDVNDADMMIIIMILMILTTLITMAVIYNSKIWGRKKNSNQPLLSHFTKGVQNCLVCFLFVFFPVPSIFLAICILELEGAISTVFAACLNSKFSFSIGICNILMLFAAFWSRKLPCQQYLPFFRTDHFPWPSNLQYFGARTVHRTW